MPLEINLSSSKFDIDSQLLTGFGIFVISQILFLLKAIKEKETMSNTIEGKIQFWNSFKVFTINSCHNFFVIPSLSVTKRWKEFPTFKSGIVLRSIGTVRGWYDKENGSNSKRCE